MFTNPAYIIRGLSTHQINHIEWIDHNNLICSNIAGKLIQVEFKEYYHSNLYSNQEIKLSKDFNDFNRIQEFSVEKSNGNKQDQKINIAKIQENQQISNLNGRKIITPCFINETTFNNLTDNPPSNSNSNQNINTNANNDLFKVKTIT